jgi:hypothetical protein
VVGLAQGNIPSARAKNSENRWECHDLLDGMVEWSKQEVNTSKRIIWTWSMCNYKCRGLVVGLPQGNVPYTRAKNSENRWEYHDLMNVKKQLTGREVNTSKRVIWRWSMCNYKGIGLVVGCAQGNVASTRAKNSENH